MFVEIKHFFFYLKPDLDQFELDKKSKNIKTCSNSAYQRTQRIVFLKCQTKFNFEPVGSQCFRITTGSMVYFYVC